jgi:hypothetical protein
LLKDPDHSPNDYKQIITYSRWQSYTWKNELYEQKKRINQHLTEIIEDHRTDHNPAHMLERALGIAALCMRRLIECLLVTDKFRGSQISAHEIAYKSDKEWREPFSSETAGSLSGNYDFTTRILRNHSPKSIADKILHARVIAVITGSSEIPDGLLIASDTQRKSSLFHFTKDEIGGLLDKFLDDEVRTQIDSWCDENGKLLEGSRPRSVRE